MNVSTSSGVTSLNSNGAVGSFDMLLAKCIIIGVIFLPMPEKCFNIWSGLFRLFGTVL